MDAACLRSRDCVLPDGLQGDHFFFAYFLRFKTFA